MDEKLAMKIVSRQRLNIDDALSVNHARWFIEGPAIAWEPVVFCRWNVPPPPKPGNQSCMPRNAAHPPSPPIYAGISPDATRRGDFLLKDLRLWQAVSSVQGFEYGTGKHTGRNPSLSYSLVPRTTVCLFTYTVQ